MDPDTQRLIERTRQRREILNQRIAGMPEAAPRKRRTPVLESDGSEKILTEVQNNQDESPKRQCFRDVEQTLKPDTPAIQGVQSRAKDLSHLLTKDNNEENFEVPTPKPRKSISSPPLVKRGLPSPAKTENSSSISSARKGRFAALAQHINNFEDDLTRHVIQKEEEKKPRWQPPAPAKAETLPKANVVSSGKGPAPKVPVATTVASSVVASSSPKKVPVATTVASSVVASSSPKKVHAPPTPRNNLPKSPASTLTRNSPLRTSKVELNSSPKPFSPAYKDNVISPVKFSVDLTASATCVKLTTPVKSTTNPAGSNSLARTWNSPPSDLPVNAPGLNETPPESDLNKTMDEPTSKPVSQRMATWAQKIETPKSKVIEPSRQPLSSKLASFEKKITESTPRSGKASSVHVPKTPKQVCTPALSASTPAPVSAAQIKVGDPSELPVSQRMSQMQEKLSNTPLRRQDEPTAFPVGARMSAWETMTAANNVSNIKKVNPADVTPITPKPRPFSSIAPGSSAASGTPQNPPPPPPVTKSVTPAKSFRECIQEKASTMWSKKGVDMSSSSPAMTGPEKQSPSKMLCRTPSKVIHSPTKVSEGTKSAQKLLVDRCQDSITTASAKAAQERASRMAELEVIQNRWKNGILRDDNSSSDESSKVAPVDSKTPEKPTPEPKTPASSRREEARNKARAEFNSKLAEIGLVTDSSSNKEPPAIGLPASQPKTIAKPTTGGQTNSIYNLIKKREEISSQTVEEKKVKFNDSFDDSDDDSDRKIPRSAKKLTSQSSEEKEFKIPEIPKAKEEKESDGATSSDVGDEEFGSRFSLDIDDDDISLKGFVSEAVRRESILPVPAQRSSQSESSGDELGGTGDSEGSLDMPTSSRHGGYQADDDSMDEEDDSQRNAMDELLDEAMSDTSDDYDPDMDPNNVVLRRPRPNNDYDPDMDINNVQMRRKTTDPVPAHRNYNRGTDSTEDEDDNRPYSLQAYRKSANIHQHMMEPIVRSSRYAGKPVEEEEVRMPVVTEPRRDDRRAVQDRIKELQELVQQEQNVIMQTSNALNKCCMGNSYFAGSAEQVECNKLLLIACQKRQCYMTEIQRLKETGVLSHEGPGPQGSLTISDIRLPLKKEFVTKIGTSQDTTTHYFILLFKNGSQLICTQMLSTHDPMMRGSLDFPNLIKINGITGNFKLVLDIYSMSVSKEYSKDKKKKTPKKSKGYAMALESPGGPTAVRTTSFSHVTSLTLNMKCLDKNSFHLERLPYLSPLYGQIFMRLKCLMEVNVEERGFLTMFDDVSGFGAWHRRWCVLSGNKLCVWKYPDDETRKDPMAMIDLKRCITEKVGLVPRDICARPNTFEMVTVRQPLKGEHDTLVTKTYNSTTTVRHQISADSKEERIVWCNKINRTLANLRTWNADALKPTKPQPQATSSYH